MFTSFKINRKQKFLLCCALFLLIVAVLIIVSFSSAQPPAAPPESTEAPTAAPEPTVPKAYQIDGVKVLPQEVLKAGCETYACTMLLQTLGFDIDEKTFAEQYLITKPISYDDNFYRYGPDMNSAQAGDVYTGYGIYAPAMAKSMNNYFKKIGDKRKAYPLEGVPLAQLCEDYVCKDIPVMVWATTWMLESYEKESWIVDYVDENAKFKIGDTFTWRQNEHCLVLIGYDEEEYYFADSCAGEVSHFEKDLCQERYEEIGTMAIVVK